MSLYPSLAFLLLSFVAVALADVICTCPVGSFIVTPCTGTVDAVCQTCSPAPPRSFLVTACTATSDNVYQLNSGLWRRPRGVGNVANLPLTPTQVYSTGNRPSIRADFVFGGNGEMLYMYGSANWTWASTPASNYDLWFFNITSYSWAFMAQYGESASYPANSIADNVPAAGIWPGHLFGAAGDYAAGSLYLWGGVSKTGVPNNDLWRLDLTLLQWAYVRGGRSVNLGSVQGPSPSMTGDVSYLPPSKNNSMMVADTQNRLWLYGGKLNPVDRIVSNLASDLWMYDIAAGTWAWVAGSLTPDYVYPTVPSSANCVPNAAYSPIGRYAPAIDVDGNNNLWIYGGGNNQNQTLADLWKFDVTVGQWAFCGGSLDAAAPFSLNPVYPVSRVMASMVYYPPENAMYVVAGRTRIDIILPHSDIYKFDIASNAFTQVTADLQIDPLDCTFSPAKRWQMGSYYYSQRLWFFGGRFGSQTSNNVYSFLPEGQTCVETLSNAVTHTEVVSGCNFPCTSCSYNTTCQCVKQCAAGYWSPRSGQPQICSSVDFIQYDPLICQACSTPPANSFLISACTATSNAVYQTCSAPPPNSFLVSACTATSDAVYQTCSAPPPNSFLVSACTATSNAVYQTCSSPPANSFLVSACTATSDAVYQTCSSPPPNSFLVSACTATSDAVYQTCSALPANSFLVSACTATSDAVYQTCTATCPSGTYLTAACSATQDIQCTPWTTCGSGQYILTPGTSTTNAVCTACATCPNGKWISTQCLPTGTQNTVCSTCTSSCPSGTYVSAACTPTSTTNLQCSQCSTCGSGTYKVSSCQTNQNTVCAACSTCANGKFISQQCTATSNTQCQNCQTCGQNSYITQQCLPTGTQNTQCQGCGNCNGGTYAVSTCNGTGLTNTQCQACTTCTSGKYESTGCQSQHNRVCTTCSTCPIGQYVGLACNGNQDTHCQNCKTCGNNQYITQDCSNTGTVDTQCQGCSNCPNGKFASVPCNGSGYQDTVCTTCTTCPSGKTQVSPCNPNQDRTCA